MKRGLRQYWLAVHLYCGVALGGLFVLFGVTGSLLVFYLEIDATLNPQIKPQQTVQAPPSVEAVLRTLRQRFPERDGPWLIEMPLTPDSPLTARYYKPLERAGRFFSPMMVTLDPSTLTVTSQRFWGDYAMTWIYDLHYTLLLNENGHTAVGILGLFMLISLGSGLYLWWPSRRRLFAALRLQLRKGSARRVYDLHVLSGVYFWIVLLLLALTGAALALPGTTRSVLSMMSDLHAPMKIAVPVLSGTQALDLDHAIRIAQAQFPQAEVRWVESSGVGGNPVFLRLYQAGEPGRRFPHTKVWLQPQTGEVLAVHDPVHNGAGDTVLAWLHALHNGEALGLTGRIIVLCTGMVLPLLFITGLIRWRQKSRAVNSRIVYQQASFYKELKRNI